MNKPAPIELPGTIVEKTLAVPDETARALEEKRAKARAYLREREIKVKPVIVGSIGGE